MKVYMDNAATTKVDDDVLKAMLPYIQESYGNASSMHDIGQKSKEGLELARESIAKSINAEASEIFFTSGGTESNNFAIKGIAWSNVEKGKHIITAKTEHDCVLNSCKWLEKNGFEVTYVGVDKEGFIKIDELKKAIRKDTILVSIMHANNEIGTIQPVEEISKICIENKIPFHTDACQSYTKTSLDVKKLGLSLVTINAHKIHGPKGVGALYIKKGTKITPLLHGGGHESGKRSGTENIPGVVGFAKAVEIASRTDWKKISSLRDYMIDKISKEIPDVILTGSNDLTKRLPNNVNFIFKFIEGEGLLMYLNMDGIAVSTGSACSSHTLEPSHVLISCGYKHELAHGSIRFSMSKYTTKEEIDYTIEKVKIAVDKLRAMSPLRK
jgi:cysteine desulfurase